MYRCTYVKIVSKTFSCTHRLTAYASRGNRLYPPRSILSKQHSPPPVICTRFSGCKVEKQAPPHHLLSSKPYFNIVPFFLGVNSKCQVLTGCARLEHRRPRPPSQAHPPPETTPPPTPTSPAPCHPLPRRWASGYRGVWACSTHALYPSQGSPRCSANRDQVWPRCFATRSTAQGECQGRPMPLCRGFPRIIYGGVYHKESGEREEGLIIY